MPLFGFRTHKKYDKDFSEKKPANVTPDKSARRRKQSKGARVETHAAPTAKITVPKLSVQVYANAAESIIRPHITEKSGMMSQNGVYTFEVARNADKQTVSKAITTLYKVHPVKVAVINVPVKKVFVRGKKGTVPGMRKAMVTVKKGEKIDFV